MPLWRRIEPTTVTKIGWRVIVAKTFLMPDSKVAEWQTMARENGHCIATIALTNMNQVIVVRQFRCGPEEELDELPGGGVEEGEDWAAAAERELLEETGYHAKYLEHLGDIYKDAYANTTWHFYLATGCEKVGNPTPDEGEHPEPMLISIAQLFDNARHLRMSDTEAVFLAYERLKELQEAI